MTIIGSLKRARAAYELGRKLQAAIDRGRHLHPWVSYGHSAAALRREIDELDAEITKLHNGAHTKQGLTDVRKRIKDEALDCAVVALRIHEGS